MSLDGWVRDGRLVVFDEENTDARLSLSTDALMCDPDARE